MVLLTSEDRKVLPSLGGGVKGDSSIAYVHLRSTEMDWDWYILEWDGGNVAFGLVDGHEVELGDIWLPELAESGAVVRDNNWRPTSLRIVRADINARRQFSERHR